ncbi:MAG TPA: hypothetical protein PK771_07095 [Spirochaetota bacterium]|nr:hypothetical protein [Spirochaetota bacterium]
MEKLYTACQNPLCKIKTGRQDQKLCAYCGKEMIDKCQKCQSPIKDKDAINCPDCGNKYKRELIEPKEPSSSSGFFKE